MSWLFWRIIAKFEKIGNTIELLRVDLLVYRYRILMTQSAVKQIDSNSISFIFCNFTTNAN